MLDTDVTSAIRAFLAAHLGQHCVLCVARATIIDPNEVQAALKPSKAQPYSFMRTTCGQCGSATVCVAFVGERSTDRVGKTAGGGAAADRTGAIGRVMARISPPSGFSNTH